MYNIPTGTLFLGKNLIVLDECASTNTYAMELSQSGKAPEGTVVITHHQTSGRGQRGNNWESGKGINLTFSLIVHPVFLTTSEQFQLNKAVALAVHEAVSHYVSADSVAVKWPNDIMIGSKKTCGILIENQLSGNKLARSVIGIGLNVNQGDFALPTATSISLHSGKAIELTEIFSQLIQALEWRYLQLKRGLHSKLDEDYLATLYWKDQSRKFEIEGTEVRGVIRGVEASGKLQVEIDNQLRSFDLKEIKHLS